jgi:dTDP-4-dehydrorhamnose reductase
MKILLTGANGQLAGEFQRLLEHYPHEVAALDREMLDISNDDHVEQAFIAHTPDIVFNCAAYNLVDRAEQEYESAFRVNAMGVRNLARASKKMDSLLVHFSSDYVFDGTKEDFYTEEDITNPLNKYGESKLSGELFLKEETDNFLLFRVSWVFGAGQQNFLYKLLEWAKQKKLLKVVCDQISVPTCTRDIAHLTMFAINKGLRGVYHLTNSGYASRYEVARFFLEKTGMDNLVLPVRSDAFPSPAKRPYFSAMSNIKLSRALDVQIPDWRIGIESQVKYLFEKGEI